MELDELDMGILRLLTEDARLSFRAIAEKLGSTTPTVSARVKALEDVGIIRGYGADVDSGVLGGSAYVVTLRVALDRVDDASKKLAGMDAVEEVLLLSGGVLQARVQLQPPGQTMGEIHAAIVGMGSVLSYDVAEVLAVRHKRRARVLPKNVTVACHLCGGPIRGDPVKKAFGGRTHVFCCRGCLGAFAKRFEKLADGA